MIISIKKYGTSWRPAFSAIVGFGWFIFIIAWLAFFSADVHPYEKKIAIILLSLLIAVILIGGVWVVWAVRMIPRPGKQMIKFFGFKSRMITSIITPLAAIGFLIYYFWFYDFTIWQHIAMILITIIGTGMILTFVWTSWKKSMSTGFEKRMEDMGKDIERNFEKSMNKNLDEEE